MPTSITKTGMDTIMGCRVYRVAVLDANGVPTGAYTAGLTVGYNVQTNEEVLTRNHTYENTQLPLAVRTGILNLLAALQTAELAKEGL